MNRKTFLLGFLIVTIFINFSKVQANLNETFGKTDIPLINVNWSKFWNLFNQYSEWNLEYNNGSGWIEAKTDLTIIKTYFIETDVDFIHATKENGTCVKITLNFTASQNADYRLTFGIDLDVKNYTYREDKYRYIISYQNHTVYFDWSDLLSIPNLQITHGIKPIGDYEYFWFRIRKDNIPKGVNVIIDPTFGKTDVGETWFTFFGDRLYSCQFNLTETGTVNKICLFAGNNEYGNDFRLAIYNSTWDTPNSRWNPDYLMGETLNISAPTSGTNKWQNISANIELEYGEYHIAWRVEDDWGGKRDDGGFSQTVVSATGQGSPNNNFPNDFPLIGVSRYSYEVSIFAEYTTIEGQEKTYILFETVSPSETLTIKKEKKSTFTETVTLTEQILKAMEMHKVFPEIIYPSASLNIKKEMQKTLFEVVNGFSQMEVSKEFKITFFEFFETLKPKSNLEIIVYYPPVSGGLSLALIALVIALFAIVIALSQISPRG